MRIFLTGGGGYLGSNLIEMLLGEAELVLYGHGRNFKWLEGKFGKSFKAIQGDVTEKGKLVRSMRGADIVAHLAATMEDVNENSHYPMACQNIFGTNRVLEGAKENGVKRFIFASSYTVYGRLKDAEQETLAEDGSLNPTNFYATTKLISEKEVLNAGIDYVTLRLSHVYGYGVGIGDFGGVLLHFIESALAKGEIVLTHGEDDIRDYIHVRDVVHCLKTIVTSSSIKNEIFNLGSGQSITLGELAELISQLISNLLGRRAEIISSKKERNYGLNKPRLNIGRIRERLHFEPRISLTEGITDLIRNLKESRHY
jgi:nucleoside-diphosphate-sugar epimerase